MHHLISLRGHLLYANILLKYEHIFDIISEDNQHENCCKNVLVDDEDDEAMSIFGPENVINNYYQLMDKYLKLVVSGRNHDNQNGVQLRNMKIYNFCEVK